MNSRKTSCIISNKTYIFDLVCKCPFCGVFCDPTVEKQGIITYKNSDFDSIYYNVLICKNPGCLKQYFTVHLAYKSASSRTVCKLIYSYPVLEGDAHLIGNVDKVSPSAASAYRQTISAKNYGLAELVGMGFRKTIDLLLYDIGEVFYPDESEFNNNSKTSLMSRARKYITESRLLNLFETCAWLENDFTHPIRRYSDVDVLQLEYLIECLLYHVNMIFLATNAKSVFEAASGAPGQSPDCGSQPQLPET